MATLKCGFPLCSGYPPSLLGHCMHCNRNSLHHLCQTAYAFNEGYDFPMTKKCYSCVLVAIAEYNKKNNKTSTSVAPPTDNDILPTDTNPTDTNVAPPNGNNNTPTSTSVASPTDNNILPTDTSVAPPNEKNITPPTMNKNITTDTIPTNVAPERGDFFPPKDIDIGGGMRGDSLQTQNGFSKNSGIFGIEIMFIGKTIGAEPTLKKMYGRIVDVPNKKKNQTDYVIE